MSIECRSVSQSYSIASPLSLGELYDFIDVNLTDPSTYVYVSEEDSFTPGAELVGDGGSVSMPAGGLAVFNGADGNQFNFLAECETSMPLELYYQPCESGCEMFSSISVLNFFTPVCNLATGECTVLCQAAASCVEAIDDDAPSYIDPLFPPPGGGETTGGGSSGNGQSGYGTEVDLEPAVLIGGGMSISIPREQYAMCLRTLETSCGHVTIKITRRGSGRDRTYRAQVSGPGAECPSAELGPLIQSVIDSCPR